MESPEDLLIIDEANENGSSECSNEMFYDFESTLTDEMINRTINCNGLPKDGSVNHEVLYEQFHIYDYEIIYMKHLYNKHKNRRYFTGQILIVFPSKEKAKEFMNLDIVLYDRNLLTRKWHTTFLEEGNKKNIFGTKDTKGGLENFNQMMHLLVVGDSEAEVFESASKLLMATYHLETEVHSRSGETLTGALNFLKTVMQPHHDVIVVSGLTFMTWNLVPLMNDLDNPKLMTLTESFNILDVVDVMNDIVTFCTSVNPNCVVYLLMPSVKEMYRYNMHILRSSGFKNYGIIEDHPLYSKMAMAQASVKAYNRLRPVQDVSFRWIRKNVISGNRPLYRYYHSPTEGSLTPHTSYIIGDVLEMNSPLLYDGLHYTVEWVKLLFHLEESCFTWLQLATKSGLASDCLESSFDAVDEQPAEIKEIDWSERQSCFLYASGFNNRTRRNDIKYALRGLKLRECPFLIYDTGDTGGYLVWNTPFSNKDYLEQIDGKFQVNGADISVRLVENDEQDLLIRMAEEDPSFFKTNFTIWAGWKQERIEKRKKKLAEKAVS